MIKYEIKKCHGIDIQYTNVLSAHIIKLVTTIYVEQ